MGFEGNYWWIYMIVGVIGFVVNYLLAQKRGRNPILWGFFGFILFLPTLIVLLIVGQKKSQT